MCYFKIRVLRFHGIFFKTLFIYWTEKEITRKQKGRQREREEAGPPLSREPNVGLDPTTLRSRPEPKAEA